MKQIKKHTLFFALIIFGFLSTNAQTCYPDITAPSGLVSGINYNYYEGSWNNLPDFNSLTAVSSGVASGINLNNASNADNFGLTFDGYINVPSNGDYTFYTTSDDGSALHIDGNEVVDNDGLHGARERSGTICLDAGYHEISVEFFEKTGGNVLSASFSGPGISKTIISDLYSASGDVGGCTKTTAFTEAECFDDENGVIVEASGNTGGENLGFLDNNDWARYNDINLSNMNSFNASVSTQRSGTSIEVRLNGTNGTLIATLSVPNNGDWHSYTSRSTPLSTTVSGTQDIFLVFKGGNLNIGSFGFTGNSTGATDCAGVTNGTASIDGCGICSGGNTGISPSSPQTWYEDVDGDGVGEASSSVQDCDQPSGYVASSGDNCPNDANKTSAGSCGCGVIEGACSGCTKTTAFTEAECFDDENGVVVEPSGNTGGENLGFLDNNDWARYNDIDLSNVNTFNASVSTQRSGTSIEVRLNGTNGTLIATLSVPNNGDWHSYTTRSTPLSTTVTGTHDVYLVFKGGNLNIDAFGFSDENVVVTPSSCSSLTSNISLSHNNPGCSNNDGSITVTFANSSSQSQIQLSINGGSSYPVTVNDNSGSYTFTGLSNNEFEVAARYANNVCEFNVGTIVLIQDCGSIPLTPGGVSWHDSYQANGHCWCSTNFDHDLDDEEVTINGTKYNVVDICDELEDHPLFRNRANSDEIYNDVQCGNGPLNNSVDEPLCPGRVDIGVGGCLETGHHWDMEWLASRSRFGSGSARTGSLNEIGNMVFVVPTIAVDKITIEGVSIGQSFKIYSTEGALILEDVYLGDVNVEDLVSGVYILKTEKESVRFTKQ